MVRNSWKQRKGDVMAIEKLSKKVYIDREAKVIYFSSLDDESKYLIETNKEEGFTVKSVSEMPKPKPRKRRKSTNPNSRMTEAEILKVATPAEKKKFEATKKDKGYLAARGEFLKNRKDKGEAETATK